MDLSGTFDLKAEAKTEITASHSERTKAIIEKDLCMEMIEAAYPFLTRKKEIIAESCNSATVQLIWI